ncbi:MAG: hypothetical protein ABF876_00415 [Acetobacter aceti]|uniref:hypothetical protein n=1 Tax=Acetobacter aceti TaxID=435 RepID=UPI0011EA5687|nr:hypothetical protein [Acetobacter aceti]
MSTDVWISVGKAALSTLLQGWGGPSSGPIDIRIPQYSDRCFAGLCVDTRNGWMRIKRYELNTAQ